MRLSINKKIALSISLLVLLSLLTTMAIYRTFLAIQHAYRITTQVEGVSNDAAYEMEINVVETGFSILQYLDTGEPHLREKIVQDAEDFARFLKEYTASAEDETERALGQQIARLYDEYGTLGQTQIAAKDRQEAAFLQLSAIFAQIDELLDEQIQASLLLRGAAAQREILEVQELETNVAEIGTWLGNYLRVNQPAYRERILDNVADVRRDLTQIEALTFTETEKQGLGLLAGHFTQATAILQEILTLHDTLGQDLTRFLTLRTRLDDVLDDEIQTHAKRDLQSANNTVTDAARRTAQLIVVGLPAFLLCSIGLALWAIRTIQRPLAVLQEGTAVVTAGNLDHRVRYAGNDEFYDLVQQFNLMVARLQETTVSKARLEASETQLLSANAQLSQEIAEHARTEITLRQTNEQLREAVQTIQTTQARMIVQENLATVGRLAAGIAHDFNNVLTGILGFTQLLQLDDSLSVSVHEILATIRTQGERAATLVRQILDFSRQSLVQPHVVNLGVEIDKTIALLRRTLPETIEMTYETETGSYFIWHDEGQLQQVLTNLAINARDAMAPAGGELRFRLFRPRPHQGHPTPVSVDDQTPWLVLEVTDTGSGISPTVMNRIFEPFFTTKDVGQGTGLGLAQVYGIVKQHGGDIEVRSQVGHGTTFSLYFPLLELVESEEAAPAPSLPRGNGETLLLVEDEEIVRRSVHHMLQYLGYQVLEASNGEEALRVYEQHQQEIAGIITDLVMPLMGGEELYQTLIARGCRRPVLILTGYPLLNTGQSLLQQEAVAWLPKPPSLPQLARAVHRIVDARHT
jgi:signal transduction histidine kinase/ActR/RegA family two-component response regulator